MPPVESKKKRIVLIEDEETLSSLIERKLKGAGYQVYPVADGKKGLALIKTLMPDLVLLDIMLPSMSGLTILEALAKEKIIPMLPVIVISNSGQPLEAKEVLRLGARDYLIKVNLSPEEVLVKVKGMFDGFVSGTRPDMDSIDSTLPVPSKEHLPSASVGKLSGKNSLTVLIVEDDAVLVALLEKKSLQEGFRVFKAFHVGDAREILKKDKVDIILLDVVLPDMDGFTFLAELKGNPLYRGIPVVIISNLGQYQEIEKGLKLGAVDYLIKANILPSDIIERVKIILHKT